jgi:hypothetical protein
VERLSASEQRALQRAEVTIAKGMKAFVAVGLASRIREIAACIGRSLHVEEYCARRWNHRGHEVYLCRGQTQLAKPRNVGRLYKLDLKMIVGSDSGFPQVAMSGR